MAHFQPEITPRQRGWKVETRDAGTCYVPGDVVPVPVYLAKAYPFQESDNETFELLCSRLADYVEGRQIVEIEIIQCFFARMSAPGYLDCTDWEAHPTVASARRSLKEED